MFPRDPEYRSAYADMVRCVNATILETARMLHARDPGAIVIFLSDHGTTYTVGLDGTSLGWDAAQYEERLPNFLAVRMPTPCAGLSGAARSLVNVMEVVFACIEGRRPKLRQDRFFIVEFRSNADYGIVREVSVIENAGTGSIEPSR